MGEKESKTQPPSLKHIFPFISTKYSPLIDELDGAQPMLLAVSLLDVKRLELWTISLSSNRKTLRFSNTRF
jgi:hypothetical protein